MFEVLPTDLPDLVVLRPHVFTDDRGCFVKTFHSDAFRENGIDFVPAEEYFSVSHKNVLRGMHLQEPPAAHNKLVYCAVGRVLDVVVDLRKSSPTHGNVFSRELCAVNREMLFIPVGFAHGFLAMEDDSMMVYQASTTHAPEHDKGILWSSIDFMWPVVSPIVSVRDSRLPPLAEFHSPF